MTPMWSPSMSIIPCSSGVRNSISGSTVPDLLIQCWSLLIDHWKRTYTTRDLPVSAMSYTHQTSQKWITCLCTWPTLQFKNFPRNTVLRMEGNGQWNAWGSTYSRFTELKKLKNVWTISAILWSCLWKVYSKLSSTISIASRCMVLMCFWILNASHGSSK